MICTLFLPELVDLNTFLTAAQRNRFVGANIKKEMTNLVAMECRIQKIPHMKQITDFSMVWTHKNRKKDFDNVEFGVKFIKDGMVEAGVIKNDGWKHFPTSTLHQHKLGDKQSVEVRIEYIPL